MLVVLNIRYPKYCIIIDILTHQIPLYRMLTNKKSSTDKCATYVIIPVTLYTFVNYFRGINVHKIGQICIKYMHLV